MIAQKHRPELLRLQAAFAREADRFPDITLSILYLTQGPTQGRAFRQPNHAIFLWQYYGMVGGEADGNRLLENLQASDFKWGLKGCQFTCMAVIEGLATPLFVRMASRAGTLFADAEARRIGTRALGDFSTNAPAGKPVSSYNHHPLAVWLNFLLHRLGKTHTGYLPESQIAVDPFAASLAALDALLNKRSRKNKKGSDSSLAGRQFRVSLSFPGEHRTFVEGVAAHLVQTLGKDCVFYDRYYEAELARPNLDLLLQQIYHDQSQLVVVFLCQDYERKEWCGLEWRAIRDLIKQRKDERVMLLRFSNTPIAGLFGIDGHIDLGARDPAEVSQLICQRLATLRSD